MTDVRPVRTTAAGPVRFAVIGLDHAHVNGQIAGLVRAGAVFAGRAPSPVHDAVTRSWPDTPDAGPPRCASHR